jgi:lysophospholipase L1-like esterase
MWPHPNDGVEGPLWNCYAKMLWSEQFVASEAMMALLDAQTFAKANGFKLIVANAFNQHGRGVRTYLSENTGTLADKFDWSTFVHESTDYVAFMQHLIRLDGLMKPGDWGAYHNFYRLRDWPSKYLTNCDGAHPTLHGYKVIANELAKFINNQM